MTIGNRDLTWISPTEPKSKDLSLKQVKERNLIKPISEVETALFWMKEIKLILLRINDIADDDYYSIDSIIEDKIINKKLKDKFESAVFGSSKLARLEDFLTRDETLRSLELGAIQFQQAKYQEGEQYFLRKQMLMISSKPSIDEKELIYQIKNGLNPNFKMAMKKLEFKDLNELLDHIIDTDSLRNEVNNQNLVNSIELDQERDKKRLKERRALGCG